jgi:glycosyltransferase involved in cell wall biosynthesis
MPSVSAMVLTCPGREHFRAPLFEAIERFTLAPDEIIEMDGPDDVGIKRDRALRLAKGEILVLLDDDDWHHPMRIEKQVRALELAPFSIVGTSNFYVHDLRKNLITYSRTWGGCTCMPAGSLAFWREPALALGFLPGHSSEEQFQAGWRQLYGDRVIDVRDASLFVHRRHGKNVSPDGWVLTDRLVPAAELVKVFGGLYP